jgi:transcriptional regulator with XRE-family HTH domain
MSSSSPAKAARLAKGLSAEELSSTLGICPRYLRQVEREGCPLHLAQRLSRILGVGLETFLPQPTGDRTRKRNGKSRTSPPKLKTRTDYRTADDEGLTEEEMIEWRGDTDLRGYNGAKVWPKEVEDDPESEEG